MLPHTAGLGYVLLARGAPEVAMFPTPKPSLSPNTYAYESEPMVKPTGFREYDARWLFEKEINLMGVQALGMGLGTLIHKMGVRPQIAVGHDFRSYSASIKYALVTGLMAAGCKVHDIGLAVTPMAYFAQFDLDVPCVAMVTASHNDNGWTGPHGFFEPACGTLDPTRVVVRAFHSHYSPSYSLDVVELRRCRSARYWSCRSFCNLMFVSLGLRPKRTPQAIARLPLRDRTAWSYRPPCPRARQSALPADVGTTASRGFRPWETL
jgi:hypothetical protein